MLSSAAKTRNSRQKGITRNNNIFSHILERVKARNRRYLDMLSNNKMPSNPLEHLKARKVQKARNYPEDRDPLQCF